MHFKNVKIFCEVASRRSFSKAAKSLHVSQSAASQAVHSLEKQLEIQLIDRSQRPLELTPAGKIYFDGCRDVLESLRKVEDRIQGMKDRVTGTVRVAAIYSVGLLQMNSDVRSFRNLYPETDLRLEYLHPDDVYSKVMNDEADLGLVSFPKESNDLSCIPWQEQSMVAIVAPEHPLANRNSISVKELDKQHFVGFDPNLTISRKMDRWFKKSRVAVEFVQQFDNIENIKRAVEIGSEIGILPYPTVLREIDIGTLVALQIEDVEWYRPLGIVHKKNKTFTTAVSKFVELLHDDSTPHLETSSLSENSSSRRWTLEAGDAGVRKKPPRVAQSS